MLTYTLDLLTAQRFGQPTVGYGCETRDLCNVCVYKVMQFVTVKIKCDDIYISVLRQGSPEGDRSEHIRCLQTAAIVFRESITFAVCVCGCPSFPLSLPWWSCGGGRRRRRVAVVIAVVIVVVVVKSCSPRGRSSPHALLALDELVTARGDSRVVRRCGAGPGSGCDEVVAQGAIARHLTFSGCDVVFCNVGGIVPGILPFSCCGSFSGCETGA